MGLNILFTLMEKSFSLIAPDRITYCIFGRQIKTDFCYDENTDSIVVRCEFTLVAL